MCFLINFLFWWSAHWFEWDVQVSYYYCVTVNFSFYVCLCLSCVSRGSYVWCIDIYNCYVFLLNWSLDHYVMPFLISCNFLMWGLLLYLPFGFCPPKIGPVVCVNFMLGEICVEVLFVCLFVFPLMGKAEWGCNPFC